VSHTFLNLCTITYEFAQLCKNICFGYESCGVKVNMCCRLYEVLETVSEKLCVRRTLKFVEILLIAFRYYKIVNFGKCEGDSSLSTLTLLNSGLKTVLELILLYTFVHSIHVLCEIEIFIFRNIYHK
jgi:hypothetical protein